MQKSSVFLREYILAAEAGGAVYAILEVLWRGYTHWSMVFAGALCAVLLYRIRLFGVPLFLRCLIGTACITLVELAVGCVVNLWWKLDVWDYSGMSFHLWGQICPAYAALWFCLCPSAFWLCGQIRKICRQPDNFSTSEYAAPAADPQKSTSRTGQTAV